MQEAKIVEKNSFSCKVSNQVSSLTSAPVKDPCHQSGERHPGTTATCLQPVVNDGTRFDNVKENFQ